ncbi:cytochrome P450 [Lasiosphaeria ovina]|uniref:Cytochrome P450 n=1 Tax=Lasiosphaeria ovina TaxID=92902 RepID=A0AAE0K3V9_9PEZI|nr:cytochrome P450 [Lasiosphaeria ovina]
MTMLAIAVYSVLSLFIGVPIRIIPIDHLNSLWMLVDRAVLSLVKRLPFVGKTSLLGDGFVLVTPGRNWFYRADPDALMEVFRRRSDFPRCLELTGKFGSHSDVMNVFGPNISTVDGAQWKMQRKLIATYFTEQNNETAMLQNWVSKSPVTTIAPDTRSLTLGVLSKLNTEHDNLSRDFEEPLQTILENCILIMALGPSFFAAWKSWLPRRLVRLHEACAVFQRHMRDTYEDGKISSSSASSPRDHNLMTSLVRASQDNAQSGAGLTEQEIYGNMFVLNSAGHDMAAHTFAFSLYFLAPQPDVQEWVAVKLRRVLGTRPPSERRYGSDFPRLKRRARTDSQVQALVVDDGRGKKTDVVLPPRTMVIPAYSAIQSNQKYWGPIRTFLGWSRDCPGKKFSHVEFHVDPLPLGKEVEDSNGGFRVARERVLKQIESDSAPIRSPLVWTRRDSQ